MRIKDCQEAEFWREFEELYGAKIDAAQPVKAVRRLSEAEAETLATQIMAAAPVRLWTEQAQVPPERPAPERKWEQWEPSMESPDG